MSVAVSRQNAVETSTVRPGAKLLCINDRGLRRRYSPGPVVRGHVYCVREVYEDLGQTGVLVIGIAGPRNSAGLECGFFLSRFRMVHD